MTNFSAMSDKQLAEYLATRVMGWWLDEDGYYCSGDQETLENVEAHYFKDDWQPCDPEHLHQAVECAEKLANEQTIRVWYEYYAPDKMWHCGFAIPPIAERGYADNPARALCVAVAMVKE